jgi:two-component system nitrate/nitrite response regulator NarL
MIDEHIDLVIVDDHPGVRKGIINLLKAADDIVVVGEAANGKQAIKLAVSKNPHIILLDVELPDMRGDVVLQHIHAELPDIKVLAISAYSDRQYILGMMDSGASGYLTKEVIPAMLVKAIRSIVYEGMVWIGPRVIKDNPMFETTLTQKEVEIMKHLLVDQSESTIASKLGMSVNQVGKYLELLMKKYQVQSLAALRQIAQQLFSDTLH